MNTTTDRLSRWSGGALGTPEPLYGACPNCDRTLFVAATGCPHCRAIFDATAAWRVRPDASRVPDAGTALSAPQPATDENPQRAALLRALPPGSLAGQILAGSGVVTLAAYRRDFSAVATLAQSAFAWGYVSFHVAIGVVGLGESTFNTGVKLWLWLTPLALVIMYRIGAAVDDWEVDLRTVQLDLAAGELSIERRLISETESTTRRVPLAKLRLAADLRSSDVDGEGRQCRRNPSIRLVVPADLPRWTGQVLELLPADHGNPRSAAAICAALLAHTGIPPLTSPAEAAGAR